VYVCISYIYLLARIKLYLSQRRRGGLLPTLSSTAPPASFAPTINPLRCDSTAAAAAAAAHRSTLQRRKEVCELTGLGGTP
jgi:hypothetical protein